MCTKQTYATRLSATAIRNVKVAFAILLQNNVPQRLRIEHAIWIDAAARIYVLAVIASAGISAKVDFVSITHALKTLH